MNKERPSHRRGRGYDHARRAAAVAYVEEFQRWGVNKALAVWIAADEWGVNPRTVYRWLSDAAWELLCRREASARRATSLPTDDVTGPV